MDARTNLDIQPEIKDDQDRDFEVYRQVFTKTMKEAARKIREVITEAERTLAAQLEQLGLEEIQLDVVRSPDTPLAPITAETVNDAFARAREILKQPDYIFAAVQNSLYTQQQNLQHQQAARQEAMHMQAESATPPPGSQGPQAGLPPLGTSLEVPPASPTPVLASFYAPQAGLPPPINPPGPAAALPGSYLPQEGLPSPGNPLEAVSVDPIAANAYLMSQTMESLDAALGTLLQSMDGSGSSETEKPPIRLRDLGIDV